MTINDNVGLLFLFSMDLHAIFDDIRLPCANKNAILFLSNANDFDFFSSLLFLYKQKYLLEK